MKFEALSKSNEFNIRCVLFLLWVFEFVLWWLLVYNMSARADEQRFLIVTFSSSYLGFTFVNIIHRSPCQTCLGCSHYTGIAFAPVGKPSWIRRLLFTHKNSDFGDFCNWAKLRHAALKWPELHGGPVFIHTKSYPL